LHLLLNLGDVGRHRRAGAGQAAPSRGPIAASIVAFVLTNPPRPFQAVEWPLTHAAAFAALGITPPKGILLYGPPGCSKTLMAKALANHSSRNFIAVKGPELFSMWVGESEKAVTRLFARARAASPSIVFFDEVDAIAAARSSGSGEGADRVAERVLSQILIELDGVTPLTDVTVIAATNRPDMCDRALLRPGRIDRILYVGPPDQPSRAEIFAIELKRMRVGPGIDLAELARRSEGLSGAEITAVCREAALKAMESDRDAAFVSWSHFLAAVSEFRPRITPAMKRFYEEYRSTSGLTSID
jgi:AAA family ATPase